MTKIDPIRPAEGYSVISPTMAAISQYGLYYKHPNIKPWYEQIPPREKVGTLLLYYIPPGSLRSR
jgi:hypothetical protein